MSDDDDLGKTYDLDAWAPPAPSAGLADAVIARLRQPPAAVAIEPEAGSSRRWWSVRPGEPGRAAAPKAARRLIARPGEPGGAAAPKAARRWMLAGGVAGALAAAVLAVVVIGMRRVPGSGSGTVIADKARSVELGESRVQLDPGTELSWERDESRVRAVLRKGAATFSVAGDDTFVIDGAGLASVNASGASLRMEAKMNLSDARVIGASAVTAAAVAILTIVVYEGQAKATHAGQTVNIEAGGTLEVRAPGPAKPGPVAVGAGPDDRAQREARLEDKIDRVAAMVERLKQEKALEDKPNLEDNLATGDPTNRTAPKKPPPPPAPPAPVDCDADVLTARGDEQASSGMWAAALSSWESSMRCKPNATLLKKAAMAACNSKNAPKAKLYVSKLPPATATGVVQICVRNGIELGDASCDPAEARTKGEDALQIGKDSLALDYFEVALGCGAGADVEKLAVLAACRINDAESALRHTKRLPDAARQQLIPVCARNGVDISIVQQLGQLRVSTKPASRVFVDGKELGQTPMTMNMVPGKYKITFQIGDSKYSFPAEIENGKTVTMVKDLE